MSPLTRPCAPPGARPGVSRRRIAHVLHRLLDEELDLVLGIRGLQASAVGARELPLARAFGRHAERLDLILAAIVFQLRGSHGTPPAAVWSALVCDDLRFVVGAAPRSPLDEVTGPGLAGAHRGLGRRLTVLSAVFASANQPFLAGFFRTLRSEHWELEAETRRLAGPWQSENDDAELCS